MSVPIFHPGEEAHIGRAAADRRMRGVICTIESVKPQMLGEWRYVVSTSSGLTAMVLESTLCKEFERGLWACCAWQPKREAR